MLNHEIFPELGENITLVERAQRTLFKAMLFNGRYSGGGGADDTPAPAGPAPVIAPGPNDTPVSTPDGEIEWVPAPGSPIENA